jgi:hypothetical protein
VPGVVPDAQPERPSNRGCYLPAAHADRAWGPGRPAGQPEPDEKEPPAGLRRLPMLREPVGPSSPDAVKRAGSAAGLESLPGAPGAPGASPWLQEPPGAERRVLRRSTARPDPYRLVSAPTEPGCARHPAWPLMVLLPGRCLRRLMTVLHRWRREHPSRGRTGEVAGPPGPLPSTTLI